MNTSILIFILSVRTMVAQPLYHIIDAFRREVLRQAHGGDVDIS